VIPVRYPVARRVLLVEDHDPTRQTLGTLLARRGFTVTPAGTLAEARAQVSRDAFDLLISDLGLPDGDGCSLLAEMLRCASGVPAIAISGYGMEDDIRRSRAAGFRDHLVKPVSSASLDAVLARIFGPTPENRAS
jgi:CheY-like chemotaxis protein